MSQRLKNIVRFTGITPNVATSLPHGLMTSQGRPLVPDILAPAAPLNDFQVTADDTNITVIGNGTAVDVYCEAWHTIERSFEDVNVEDLTPQPFIIGNQSSIITAASQTLVFRPGATGAEAPGGNVFTDWNQLMVAVEQTKYLGQRGIEFDNRFALAPAVDPVLAPFLAFNTAAPPVLGLNPCAIPPPPPGQAWDLRDIQFLDRGLAPGGGSAMIQFWDGGPGRPCRVDNIKRLDGLLLNWIYNGKTPGNYPIISSRYAPGQPAYQVGIQFGGGRGRVYNTAADAQPLWLADQALPGENFVNLRNDSQLGNGVALPAPLIELGATCNFLLFGLDNFQVMDNCFKGPVGSSITVRIQSAGQAGNSSLQTYNNPQFLGSYVVGFAMNAQRWRASAIANANVNAQHGDVVRVNSATGAWRVTLPQCAPIAPSTGVSPFIGSAITVLDVGANTDSNPITIRAQVGNSINGVVEAGGGESDRTIGSDYGSLRFWNDGAGNWFIVT